MASGLSEQDVKQIGRLVFRPQSEVPPDVAIVFGSRHHGEHLVRECLSLHELHNLRAVVFSGYQGEAEHLAALATSNGLPPDIVIIEPNAKNSLENAFYSAPYLRIASKRNSVAAVCKLYSACRTWLTLRNVYPNWEISIAPVDWFGVSTLEWHQCRPFLSKLCEEFHKVLEYEGRGDIAPLSNVDLDRSELRMILARLEQHLRSLNEEGA
jgi:uncharacterized SAM-binding protein YcdF (DUF218 family)